MDFMLRFAKALALVLALGAGVRAEVVIGSTANTDSGDPIYTSGAQQYAGFTFTTTGSSAGSGKWALTNLAFNLKANLVGATATSYDLYLYKVISGSTLSPSWVYRQQNISLGGASISADSLGNGTSFSTALTGFGTVGDETSGLEANTKYYLGFNFNLSAATQEVWIQSTNSAYTGPWTANDSYFSQTDPATISSLANNTTLDYGYSLSAAAVPEPGTLLLGGIAAMGGAGGWWARRRKKAAAADAVAEGEQAATV
jgi:hypothetical protein